LTGSSAEHLSVLFVGAVQLTLDKREPIIVEHVVSFSDVLQALLFALSDQVSELDDEAHVTLTDLACASEKEVGLITQFDENGHDLTGVQEIELGLVGAVAIEDIFKDSHGFELQKVVPGVLFNQDQELVDDLALGERLVD